MSQVPPPPPKGVKPDIAPLTVLEMARRVDFAADVLLASHRRTEQKAIICAEFGVEGRQADRYLARARKRILAATQKSKDQFFAESVEFYESICRNPVHKTSDRLKARQLLDRATGVGIGARESEGIVAAAILSIEEQAAIIAQANEARKAQLDRRDPFGGPDLAGVLHDHGPRGNPGAGRQ